MTGSPRVMQGKSGHLGENATGKLAAGVPAGKGVVGSLNLPSVP